MKANRENRILIIITSIFVIGVLGYAFTRFYIEKDYIISQEISCDPEVENCFVWECDPAVEACSENEEENIEYYKVIEKRAFNIPECVMGEECEELRCEPNEKDCQATVCSKDESTSREVKCSDDLEQPDEEEILEESANEPEQTEEGAFE